MNYIYFYLTIIQGGGKKRKMEYENFKIPSCTVTKGKSYSSWWPIARIPHLAALPLTHKGSEVINCLCNMYFIQVYPYWSLTLRLVNQEPTDYSLPLTDLVVNVSVSSGCCTTGTINLHTRDLQVVGTLREDSSRRMHTGMIVLTETRTEIVSEV